MTGFLSTLGYCFAVVFGAVLGGVGAAGVVVLTYFAVAGIYNAVEEWREKHGRAD